MTDEIGGYRRDTGTLDGSGKGEQVPEAIRGLRLGRLEDDDALSVYLQTDAVLPMLDA